MGGEGPRASSGKGGAPEEPAVAAPSSYKWKRQFRKGGTEPAAEEEGVEGGSHPWEVSGQGFLMME